MKKEACVLRTGCGTHRFVMIDNEKQSYVMPLLPYMPNASIIYYEQNIKDDTPTRRFEFKGNYEYGAFDLKCRVFEEVI